jgi:signal transduction histidine kinase/ActR/RegA family two-component response regulator
VSGDPPQGETCVRNVRLRTKFLLSLLAITAGLSSATLLIVSYSVQNRVRENIREDLRNSVDIYQSFERQREATLKRSTQLLADLPNVRAMMTTEDSATIQDASEDVWNLSGSDLMVFADRAGNVVATRAKSASFERAEAQGFMQLSLKKEEPRDWWFGGVHLYEVWIQPIYFGAESKDSTLGYLAVGHEIDERAAKDFSKIASSDVAFRWGDTFVASTLTEAQRAELARQPQRDSAGSQETQIGNERYFATTVELPPDAQPSVTLTVLKSFDKATSFLRDLNRILLALGLLSVLAGSVLVFFISHTFTRPLANLVAGVRALEGGDYGFPLESAGGDEVSEVTGAFSRMRMNLQKTQAEQQKLEERLRQAHKMEAVGRLAGGVAHDFNNLLTIIRGNSDLLIDRDGADAFHKRCVEQIQKASGRAVAMTRQLLAFSRMQVLQPRVLDLNAVVAEMGKMLPRLIGEHIEHVFVPEPKLKLVTADPGQIEQVLMNLAVNSRDAMPGGGTLTVRTANVEMTHVDSTRHGSMPSGSYVLLSVSDTGIGMNEETRTHIFEPFFTTKEVGKGTGLGLATVYGIVKQSGGFIWVESALGKGTTFEIYLPLASGPASKTEAEAKQAALRRGSETILVVEDEAGVRELAGQFLKAQGYTVLEAKDGIEALEIAARHEGTIHVTLTDMIMPRMSGTELVKRLKAIRPDMKAAYMTGYAEYATCGNESSSNQQSSILQKPFSSTSLADMIRVVLAGQANEKASDAKECRVL